MTKNTYRDTQPSFFPARGERISGKAGILQVLCVHDNPVFLDRVCRHLEQRGDLSVDISISREDAVHLMRYVLFDVIVTDYSLGQMEKNAFLKEVRDTGNRVPFIYFTCSRNTEVETEALLYDPVYFVEWGEESLSRGFEELYLSIVKVAKSGPKENDFQHGVIF
jgi:CheY-like chemotaxis protein